MYLFLKLYLAHVIADFILQFEELYRLKVRSLWGHLFHAGIHFILSLLFSLPYLSDPLLWGILAVLSAIHYIQDIIKYTYQARYPRYTFYFFTVDQIIHALFVATIFFYPPAHVMRGFPAIPVIHGFFTDTFYTIVGIALLLSAFGGSYFLHSLRMSFIPHSRPDHFITSFEMGHAMFERFIITFFALLCLNPMDNLWLLPIGLFRLPFPILRNRLDFFLSYIVALSTGLFFRNFLYL